MATAAANKPSSEAPAFAATASAVCGGVPKSEAELHALERELLSIERKYRWEPADERRVKEIKSILKGAQPKGTSHQDVFAGLGEVYVAGYGEAELGRDTYEVDIRKVDAMSDAERAAILAQGIIKKKTPAARANYGKIEIELY
jgi:hypothetical protein